MIYQLASGRIIYITTEQYLALSDDELQALEGMNIGTYDTASPWRGSSIKKPRVIKEDDIDETIDFLPDSEEIKPPPIILPEDVDYEDFSGSPEEMQDID